MILLDGAFGSLICNGDPSFYKYHPNSSVYLANNLDIDREIHEQYAIAGSDVLSTHTFSLSLYCEEFESLVLSARDVANKYNKKVALSLTTGFEVSMLERAIPYVDYILLETYTSINAVEQALESCLLYSKPIIANMVFNKYFSLEGESVQEYFERISSFVDYIGFNCLTLSDLECILPQTLDFNVKLAIQPNIGIPTIKDKIVYPKFDFNNYVNMLKEYNVEVAGLCCGSTPRDIKQLRGELK